LQRDLRAAIVPHVSRKLVFLECMLFSCKPTAASMCGIAKYKQSEVLLSCFYNPKMTVKIHEEILTISDRSYSFHGPTYSS